MIVGYKCDEFNPRRNFYQVRQWNAHTWVEAYLPPDQIPRELCHKRHYWAWATNGGWLRLDPTPTADVRSVGLFGRMQNRIEDSFNWLEVLWSDYLVEMDRDRQREAVYQPAVRAVRKAIQKLSDPQWWRGLLSRVGHALSFGRWASTTGYWLGVMLLVLIGALMLLGTWWLVRFALRWWRRRRARATATDRRPQVEFYRRFEALLARQGMVRRAGQTPYEFATAASVHMLALTGRPQWQSLPLRLVEAFYRVRFGRQPLDTAQAEAVEHALAELKAVSITACTSPEGSKS
jgi:hypothetical protein